MRKRFKRFISFTVCLGLILTNSYSGGAIIDVYAEDGGVSVSGDSQPGDKNDSSEASVTDASAPSDATDSSNPSDTTNTTNEEKSGALGLRKVPGMNALADPKGGTEDGEQVSSTIIKMNGNDISLTNRDISSSPYTIYYGDNIDFAIDNTGGERHA